MFRPTTLILIGNTGLSQKDIAPITDQLPEINVQGATELNDYESQQEMGDEQDHMDDSGIFETSAYGELQDMENHHMITQKIMPNYYLKDEN